MLTKWPAKLQLYPRDKTDQCIVAIAGRALGNDVKSVSLVVLRNQQRYQYARVAVDSITRSFAFKPTIKAELSQYSFQLFTHRDPPGDSVQVAFRDSIVCGDVFLITGQSNAVGRFADKPFQSEFCRTFGVNNGAVDYNPADTAWCLTNTTEGANALWGVELQRLIKEQQGIPTAIINGAVGSTTITDHANRDGNQPARMNSLYGRLFYRASKAGIVGQVKAMIWRQGEAEAVSDPTVYVRVFPQLYSYWKQDYPGLKKVYHSQINILTDNVVSAGVLRDFQRRSKTIFGDNEPIATVGLPGYQGLHYTEAGYRQFSLELYRLVARDFYASTDTSNIQSPNLQRLYYSTPAQDEITLEFEPDQEMHWPADTTITNPATGARYTQSLSNFIYTNYPTGESGLIKSVIEKDNRLILKLTKSITAKHLTYLPSSYKDNQVGYYVGPVIRNRRGMRALTFYQVPIAPPLPVASDFRATPVDTTAIKLSWDTASDSVSQWSIERADTGGLFKPLAVVPGAATFYKDLRRANGADSLKLGKIYEYRVRSLGRRAESGYSPVATASLQLVVGVKIGPELDLTNAGSLSNSSALVYPNPASDQVRVRLPLDWSGDAITLTLTNEAGMVVLQRNNQVSSGTSFLSFSVAALPVGTYVLIMQYRTGGVRCRLTVIH
ncbi:sialate O-acetylesterase [Spirosoma flavum]|uniref:Sialate O-acetylesterase n=1 Tax=Spirosoma flavum TaxID=2048557 RepID=A0ABW6APT8_9BACT